MKNTNVIPIQKIPSMLENDYQFVDLRDPYEYKKVHLTKFTNIPYEKFNLNQYYFSKKEYVKNCENYIKKENTHSYAKDCYVEKEHLVCYCKTCGYAEAIDTKDNIC